ncbi:MAG: hypothetical protein ACRCYY_16675 [Trueperaceae bacterium]
MKRLTTITCYVLMTLGSFSFVMAIIGLSLTPLVLGGLLFGLGVLIHTLRDVPQALRELAESNRYSAYVREKTSQHKTLDAPESTS